MKLAMMVALGLAALMDEVEGDNPGGGAVGEATAPGSEKAAEKVELEPGLNEAAPDEIAIAAEQNRHRVALIGGITPVMLKDQQHLDALKSAHGDANVVLQ